MTAYIIMRYIGVTNYPVSVALDAHTASLERQRLDKLYPYAKHLIKERPILESKTPGTAPGVSFSANPQGLG